VPSQSYLGLTESANFPEAPFLDNFKLPTTQRALHFSPVFAPRGGVWRYSAQMEWMDAREGQPCIMDRFLRFGEAERALKTLRRLSHHEISAWALAGGFAVEIHCMRGGLPATDRALNDVDFVAPAFDCVPETLARDFLFRHVHPLDPPGKTILQLVDAETAVRIDLFRAYGAIMTRTLSLEFLSRSIQLISVEDVLARTARLLLALRAGVPVSAKHANDFLRLANLMQSSDVEVAWQDHRKPDHPVAFHEANTLVRGLIATHRHLLVTPQYSKDVAQTCSRCIASATFPLAEPQLVLSLLRYC
jgi:hypothetical protein